MTSHLIQECYFTVGNLLFLQSIGIPMGIDPVPFWANLYLYHYVCEFIKTLIKEDKSKAMKLRNASRLIDNKLNLKMIC